MSKNNIEVINLFGDSKYKIIPSRIKREWMAQGNGNPYRCKPMNIANSYGWDVLCPYKFNATWNGGDSVNDIKIEFDDPDICIDCAPMKSHFGDGVLTFNMDFILKTNENISIYIRSSPNSLNNGLQPLDAIVETDWMPYTFTYNFKFISPGTAEFEKDEVLYTFFPIERGFIESFDTKISSINDYPELQQEFEHYNNTRTESNYIQSLKEKRGLTGFYKRGENSMGKKYDIKNFSKSIILKKFER